MPAATDQHIGVRQQFVLAAQSDPGHPLTLGFDAGLRHTWAGFALLGYFVFLAWYVAVRPGLQRPVPGKET